MFRTYRLLLTRLHSLLRLWDGWLVSTQTVLPLPLQLIVTIAYQFSMSEFGTCDGAVNDTDGNPVRIPCDCPPSEADYISVAAILTATAIIIYILIVFTELNR